MSFPTLFLSHGAPTLALDAGEVGQIWRDIAMELPRPRAVLMISAHWGTLDPAVSLSESPDTIHDFYGFPEALYDIEYPAQGAPGLAHRVAELLEESGMPAQVAAARGLDHGAWVPLRELYPDAHVPVTQLSVQPRRDAGWHYRLGQALNPLRGEDILIIGSGGFTHNLGEFGHFPNDGRSAPYVEEFRAWFLDKLADDRHDELLHYRQQAPHAVRAHPTEEHLFPLFVALGAAGAASHMEPLYNGTAYGMLAMDALAFY